MMDDIESSYIINLIRPREYFPTVRHSTGTVYIGEYAYHGLDRPFFVYFY